MKEAVGNFTALAVVKQQMLKERFGQYFVLSILAGMYIGFGILLIFTVGSAFDSLTSPAVKILMGISFGIALTLVVFAGSELFTGNNMVMLIGCLNKKTSWWFMYYLWFICYLGNLVGALILSGVMASTGLADGNVTGDFIGKVTSAKMNAPVWQLFCRGILCNALVCLAVWMSGRTKNDTAKIFLIFWCLFAFIACGFEHSIANMTLFGTSLFTAHPDTVSWGGFVRNQIPVTLGNIVGGGFFGLVYWYATYKKEKERATDGGTEIKVIDSSESVIQKNCLLDCQEEVEFKKLAGPTKEVVPQDQIAGHKSTGAASACIRELSQWCNRLGSVLTHLRSRACSIDFNEFSEILTQLQLQTDAKSPIYIKDALIRRLAEESCPNFDEYARGKGTIKFLSTSDTVSASVRKRVVEFLQLCDKVEATALKVMNPASYGQSLPAGQSIMTEAIFQLHELRFKLNESYAALSQA